MDDISLEQRSQHVWIMANRMNAALRADDVAEAEGCAEVLFHFAADDDQPPAIRKAYTRALAGVDCLKLVHTRWERAVATADVKQMRDAVDAVATWMWTFSPHRSWCVPDARHNDMRTLLTDIAAGASLPAVVRSDARRALKRYRDWLRSPDAA